ncbi:DUF6578 domain-containing protein [Arthrobacter sp. CAN_A1]|uniref:DUF6578 domain-containing protein n=1 Tax=Arthrobacter sp. CAN_A1 TaxID=2787717 RepID=UPI003FA438B9
MEGRPAAESSCIPTCPSTGHAHFIGSYEPLRSEEPLVVEVQDADPPIGPHETDVWLTEWQVSEDRFDVALGENVDWVLVPMNQDWLAQLFAGRRPVSLQRDTCADAEQEDPSKPGWTELSGHVTRIDQVSIRYQQSQSPADRGEYLPEVGGAMQHSLPRLRERRGHRGHVVGWIVRIQAPTS